MILEEKEFLLNSPLYHQLNVDDSNIDKAWNIKFYNGSIDIFCLECQKDSVFTRKPRQISYGYEKWNSDSEYALHFNCTRVFSHEIVFYIKTTENTIQKIGQYPSIADLALQDIKKYQKLMSKSYYQDLSRAIGLSAHGVGIGSFVYLRRVFEFLVEQAHSKFISTPSWDEEAYKKSRMSEKIEMIKNALPTFLVENKNLYGILSKGVHELSEKECLEVFPLMKISIEIILDSELEESARKQKIEQARSSLSALQSKLK
ncbi:hypothetical protein [Methylovorus glucosotrophus]|uniref:Uncharacterized protein n=1 Tax=Methylovorus glucosotrophus (strain SIP3-4) TaxID=582744 RepID=C6X7H8_METGS|nr:hypothetical protein [Methylovorus glucosotrophus]ACT51443.1 conserved hypothetical protein [Methylovorus glucosotrophus SIP3-4]